MRYLGPGRTGAFEWLFQRVTGVALVIMLGVHFVIMHYMGSGPVTYEKVAPRLASGAYKAWELMFLALAGWHAMNGLKLIIDDYVHSEGWRSLLTGANWLLMLAVFIFGSVTILTFQLH